jgi:hypothetical protein
MMADLAILRGFKNSVQKPSRARSWTDRLGARCLDLLRMISCCFRSGFSGMTARLPDWSRVIDASNYRNHPARRNSLVAAGQSDRPVRGGRGVCLRGSWLSNDRARLAHHRAAAGIGRGGRGDCAGGKKGMMGALPYALPRHSVGIS